MISKPLSSTLCLFGFCQVCPYTSGTSGKQDHSDKHKNSAYRKALVKLWKWLDLVLKIETICLFFVFYGTSHVRTKTFLELIRSPVYSERTRFVSSWKYSLAVVSSAKFLTLEYINFNLLHSLPTRLCALEDLPVTVASLSTLHSTWSIVDVSTY